MKVIPVEVPSLGACELREPSIAVMRKHMALMESDIREFLIEVIGESLFKDGQKVPLDSVPFGALTPLTTTITEMLGFGSGEG